MLGTSLSGWRARVDVPADTQRAVDAMTRGSLDAEMRKFQGQLLDRVGAYAVHFAKSAVGTMGTDIAATHAISREVRENVARRDVDAPLYDTGAMRRGITRDVDRAAMTMTLYVKGRRVKASGDAVDLAYVAMLQETGYTFKITEKMAHAFGQRAAKEHGERGGDWRRTAGETGWADLARSASANVGREVYVQPRPFLGPALERAVERLSSEMPAALQEIVGIWLGGRARSAVFAGPMEAPARQESEAAWGEGWVER